MTIPSGEQVAVSRFVEFTRAEWARLRASTPLPLTEPQLRGLVALNERISLDEVSDIYLPLSRLLNLYVHATQTLHEATATFLGSGTPRVPYVIGVAGSVAVGKSTTSRILQALLARWPGHPTVDLITTDGFLLPRHQLEARGLMDRKGFPESYDLRRLVRFMADVKAGVPEVDAPVYSHLTYDIVPGERVTIRRPDIVIVEGLNVLQTGSPPSRRAGGAAGGAGRPSLDPARDALSGSRRALPMFVSDFFDFSIYVDANEADIEHWYIERFLKLRETVFQNPSSYFHHHAALTPDQASATARTLWQTINLVNLRQNVLPTRERAHLILEKGRDHAVRRVKLRKL
ncbi:MAG: type I pantothenate kinase [Acidobacteria bacterium]|nr:type I pantothenate kinase [Acidobacteriota bacterium]